MRNEFTIEKSAIQRAVICVLTVIARVFTPGLSVGGGLLGIALALLMLVVITSPVWGLALWILYGSCS